MTWDRLEVKNWQSLRNVDLTLGNFTVIVGATGSGKSALIRSIEALTSNIRGSGPISIGASKASISATVDGVKVTLEKGENSGSYKITEGKTENTFTKLGGSVPSQVSEKLRFAPISSDQASTNFAGQHDAPFLLKDSGASVARILGELTNVSKIFEAVREANRRKLNATSVLNTRKKDLVSVVNQISLFKGLKEKLTVLEQAENLYAELISLAGTVDELEELLKKYEEASTLVSSYTRMPVLPDLDSLEESYFELKSFIDLLELNSRAAKDVKVVEADLVGYSKALKEAEEYFHSILADVGQCPLCGNITSRK